MPKPTLKDKVITHVKSDVERGVPVLALGYEECNDYAQTVTNLMSVQDRTFYRFESVARYIRTWKEMNQTK
jgi:hypothetical protein